MKRLPSWKVAFGRWARRNPYTYLRCSVARSVLRLRPWHRLMKTLSRLPWMDRPCLRFEMRRSFLETFSPIILYPEKRQRVPEPGKIRIQRGSTTRRCFPSLVPLSLPSSNDVCRASSANVSWSPHAYSNKALALWIRSGHVSSFQTSACKILSSFKSNFLAYLACEMAGRFLLFCSCREVMKNSVFLRFS